jgi:DNA-binding transcriptional MerR regulator
MNSEEFLIGELAEKAGVSVRTIRYYVSEGLLPSPQTRGRYTVYDEEYLERIRLIKRLKDAFLPIKEIRGMLDTKTPQEIEEFLKIYEENRPAVSDALSYIAALKGISKPNQIFEKRMSSMEAPEPPPADSTPRFSPSIDEPKKKAETQRSGLQESPYAEQFYRFIIQPGVELHVSHKNYTLNPGLIRKMIEMCKNLLDARNKRKA